MLLDPLRATAGVRWSAAVHIDWADGTVSADELGASAIMPIASVGKLLLLATVLDEIERGRVDGREVLTADVGDDVGDSGLWRHLDARQATVLDLCRLVAAVSDNRATNVLIRRVGLDAVATLTGSRMGLRHCVLHDVVRDARGPQHAPTFSTGSAAELVGLVRRASRGELVSPQVSATLVELLRLDVDLSLVAAGLGLDPLAHADVDLGLRLFNKTGSDDGTRADVGCVESVAGERAAYAVIARYVDAPATRREVLTAMRHVGEGFVEALGR
jgi:beta-lactamase class A